MGSDTAVLHPPLRQPRVRRLASGVTVLLAGGLLERLAWLRANPDAPTPVTEVHHVAVALAATGDFADAFRPGSGATAHLSPVMPWIVAQFYRVWGIEGAQPVLTTFALALVLVSFILAFLLFRRLGASAVACLGALATVALIPLQPALEVRELITWEAPLALVGLLVILLEIVRLDGMQPLAWTRLLWPTLAASVLFQLSPPAGLTALVLTAVLAVRRVDRHQWPALSAAAATILLLISLPWALRNLDTMHRLIPTRSNAPLELALAYNDTMLHDGGDAGAAYRARIAAVQPNLANGKGYAALRAAGGELPYYDRLGAETKAWMTAHPGGTAALALRHAWQYLLPPAWFFDTWGGRRAHAVELRSAILGASLAIALCGMPAMIRRDPRYLYVAGTMVMLIAPYIVVQPILRYRYLVSTLAIFAAAEVVTRAASTLSATARHRRETA